LLFIQGNPRLRLKKKGGRELRYSLLLLRVNQIVSKFLTVDGGGDDQGGSLHLLNGIDVVLDDGVQEALVKGVSGSQDNVEARVIKNQKSGTRKGIEKIIRLVVLLDSVVLVDGRRGLTRKNRGVELLLPRLTGCFKDGGAKCVVFIKSSVLVV
jgi:hypothetical protein